MTRTHTPTPAFRGTTRATGAFPPIYNAPSMAEWKAQREARQRGWLARILSPTASPEQTGSSNSAQVVEAGLGANRGDG